MIPKTLKLSNFTSYGDNPPELDFSKFSLAVISGSNGAGKSSLLDAITWCLWGTSRAGDSADDLVRLGANDMQVDFEFTLDNHTYTVKRRRSKKSGGNTALELWSQLKEKEQNLTEGTIKSTQQKIIELLHLNYETFTNSSYLRQGHADEFTTKGATDRKRILADILGLDHYDKLEEKAKDKAKELQTKLQLLEYKLLEIEAELAKKDQTIEQKAAAEKKIAEVEGQTTKLETELKDLTNLKATLTASNEQAHQTIKTLEDLKTELNEILVQGKDRAEKIKTLEENLKELPAFEEKLAQLKKLEEQKENLSQTKLKRSELSLKISETEGQLSLKKQQQSTLQIQIDEQKKLLTEVDKTSAKCPTCGQEIDKTQKETVKAGYQKELAELEINLKKIDTSTEEKLLTELTNQFGLLKFDETEFQQLSKQIDELSTLEKTREELLKNQATLESEKKILVELRGLFAGKKSQVEKLEAEVQKLPDLSDKLTTLTTQISQMEIQLAQLKAEERLARDTLGQVNQLISQSAQLENLAKEKALEKSAWQKEKANFEELALAFGKKGIQAMIIETAIPEIEDETNSLLSKLTEGRMQVRFETQKENKTKNTETKERGIVETLDIVISDEMGERSYELYSGGETFRVNLAIRLAISKLLTHRAGAKLQFLVIDEGFGTQDSQGISKIIEALDTIKDDYEKILVVSHLDELKQEFPTRIEVSKGPSGSTFEVVNS